MADAVFGFLGNAWPMAREVKIHNDSNEPITLIPFSCHYLEDPRSAFLVRTRLAQKILPKNYIKVPRKAYNGRDGVPQFQIYMLFRSGDIPERVEPGEEEKIFLYTDLDVKSEWRLSLDNKNQVCGGPGRAADQTSSGANAAGPQIESQLRELKEEVEKLKEELKALLDRIAALEPAPAQR